MCVQLGYTEEDLESDYQAELRKYKDDTWEAPQRVAINCHKTYEINKLSS